MFFSFFISIFLLSFSTSAEKHLHDEESTKFMQDHIALLKEAVKNANKVLSMHANKSGNCAKVLPKASSVKKIEVKSETDKAIEAYLNAMKDNSTFNDIKSILWH